MRTEMRCEASLTHTMDKMLYEAFVQFAMITEQENKVKFLFDVCQYRHLCKLAHGCPEAPKETDDKKIMSGTSDRRFDMLFCIVAEYIMPMGIKEVDAPENMHMKVIGEICEHLKMGTVSHLEGYKQLRKYKPSSKIINDISMRIFGRLGEPKVSSEKNIDNVV